MFKIGTRVKVINNTAYYNVGDEGTVHSWMGQLPNDAGAWVQFDNPKMDDGLWWVGNESMEEI